MTNYKILFSLRILKSLLYTFADSFLVLYFLEVSNNNILPLGIYKLVSVISIYIVIFLLRNFCKSKNRVILLRIGIIFDFIYFLSIILLKEKVIDYMYVIGILYGLSEGFYYSVYNILESDGVKNEERAKFNGTYTAIQSILVVTFPLLLGGSISSIGFTKSLIIVLAIVILRIVLSFKFKDNNIPKSKKINLREFYKIAKKEKRIKQVYKVDFFDGLTYSSGALTYIVTIYIIKVFSDSISLGIFTSIFSLISSMIGFLFAKCIKQEHYAKTSKISMTLAIIFLCMMIYKCNMITIVIFKLFQTISKSILDLINTTSKSNMSNLEIIKTEYKAEYWIGSETALAIGRIISNLLFILMAFTNTNIIVYVFIVFLILLTKNVIKLQNTIKEDNDRAVRV